VERDRRPSLITLFADRVFAVGDVRLTDDAAHHVRVRRAAKGDGARLLDGRGHVGFGEIRSISKNNVTISIDRVVEVTKPIALEVIVPIADRDRMLLAAEKCVELQITAWRPAYFVRSRSVTPRGEGAKFQEKLRARMHSALEQSGGAWLPDLHADTEVEVAMHAVPSDFRRILFDQDGSPLASRALDGPTAMAVGPEGGLEPQEVAAALDCGWVAVSLGMTTLRFETAVIAGAAVIRAAQISTRSS